MATKLPDHCSNRNRDDNVVSSRAVLGTSLASLALFSSYYLSASQLEERGFAIRSLDKDISAGASVASVSMLECERAAEVALAAPDPAAARAAAAASLGR